MTFSPRVRAWLPGRVRAWLEPDWVRYENVRLPAPHLRFCTTDWKNDEFFVKSAEGEVDRLIELCGLDPTKRLLDIGSGQGRLAIGVQRRMPNLREYVGVDIHRPSVDWCKRNILRGPGNLRFVLLDAANARYNASGTPIDENFRLPFEDGRFDVVFLYSVFTHMTAEDTAVYLAEAARVLALGGRMLATVYVEEGVPQWEENPPDYLSERYGPPSRPLHRARFERRFLESLIDAASMKLLRLDYQCEAATGQSVIVTEAVTEPRG
jgi:SAM-dependent methyltransferase